MGAYLSKPSTEKKSSDVTNKKFTCGISGMQGWRVSMEDAYNCIPEFDEDCSLFGVYDGHGGCEVALYCAHHFGDILKENEKFKMKNFEEALPETFMEIDRRIMEKKTVQELKVLADRTLEDGPPTEEDILEKAEEELPEENETELLHEEATMSIEELLKRYGQAANAMNTALGEMPDHGSSSSQTKETTPSKEETETESSDSKDVGSSSSTQIKTVEEGGSKTSRDYNENTVDEPVAKEEKSQTSNKDDHGNQSEDSPNASGDAVKEIKEKGKVISKVKEKLKPAKLALPDDEYVPPHDSDSESEESFDSSEAIGGSEDESSEEDSEDEEDAMDELRQLSNHNEDVAEISTQSGVEEPGKDSGTTAVVAFLDGRRLIVANAGDSRCVLGRAGGTAFDMSEDHKPEDADELKRIELAGGQVNAQGRVNGGLNLSRAIGDHCYKTNDKFDLKDQMITAFPDLKTVELKSDDEFLVLACDGIWNVLTSQEVVDFVRERLPAESNKDEFKISTICEELFTRCLALDTMGDGTGCDNMTCLIIHFNNEWLKTLHQNGLTEESNTANTVSENNHEQVILNKNGDHDTQIEIKTQSVKRLNCVDDISDISETNNAKRLKLV